MIGITSIRRYTRNWGIRVKIGNAAYFCKYIPDSKEAHAQVLGHRCLLGFYPVPKLCRVLRLPLGHVIVYQDVMNREKDQGLLLDVLNIGYAVRCCQRLDNYGRELANMYCSTIMATADLIPAHLSVAKLYRARVLPGGRMDRYYSVPRDANPLANWDAFTIVANGVARQLELRKTIIYVRQVLTSPEPVWCALTQGDPTEVNIGEPLVLFDFDTAGMNSIAGEFANFLWSIYCLGGYLAPKYNPRAFRDHPLTFNLLAENSPQIEYYLDTSKSTIYVTYRHQLSTFRREMLNLYVQSVVRPIVQSLPQFGDTSHSLWPYLVMRLLGVYNIFQLDISDTVYLLARVAEIIDGNFDYLDFFGAE